LDWKVVFFFSLQLDSLLLVCIIWTQNNTNNVKGNYNLHCPKFPHYSHILQRKLCKYFVLLTSVIVTIKNDVSYKMDGYQKMCDTNKNVTKMGLIIKKIYYDPLPTFYLLVKHIFVLS
jgi:hypothetical protein